MTDAVTPNQSSLNNKITNHPKSSSVPRNFSSASYHSALDLAKAYSGYISYSTQHGQ